MIKNNIKACTFAVKLHERYFLMSHNAYLGLGTNLGNKADNLKNAISALSNSNCKIISESSIYISEPWGFNSDETFYNMVIQINTAHSPNDLLDLCKSIERKMGRKPKKSKGYESRLIDLDILYYDDIEIQTENLQIPHLFIKERLFVLSPLLEITTKDFKEYYSLKNKQLELEKKEKLEILKK